MAKKTDKTEEKIIVVQDALSNTEQFIEKNQKILIIILGVIAVIVLGYMGFKKLYVAPQNEEAQSQMFSAERYFENDSLDLALYGDGNYPGFLDIIDDYGFTKSANLAHYYAGLCFLKKGEFNDAIDYLKDFNSDDQMVSVMATGAIGDAYLELGETETALEYYLEAANQNDNLFTSPEFLLKACWVYEKLGNYEKAIEIYETIKTKYYKSFQGREFELYDIDKYIARAKKLSEKN